MSREFLTLPDSQESKYGKATNFIKKVVDEGELGYIYAFPDKRLYSPVVDVKSFVDEAWKDYEGEVGIYVHTPYCTPKPPPAEVKQAMKNAGISSDERGYLCGYCNLFTVIASEVPPAFVQGVVQEINLYKQIFQGKKMKPRSLYFGGGTPSLLRAKDLKRITQEIKGLLGEISDDREQTIECTPDSVDYQKLKAIREIGFNRISFGIQTFDEDVLHYSGRNYDPNLGYKAIEQALQIGFPNVNGDLIIGLPSSTQEVLLRDVSIMIELFPHTVTMYQDMVRPVTRFGEMAEHGILPAVSSRNIYDWSKMADDMLTKAGYFRKTLTCWVKDGGGYRQGEDIYDRIPIIGFGPGARSYGSNAHYSTDYAVSTRLANYSIHQWQQSIGRGEFPKMNGYVITPDIKIRASAIFGLMSSKGTERKTIDSDFGSEVQALIDSEMVFEQDGILRYTEKGKAYSGALSRLFFGQEIENKLKSYKHR